MPKAIDVMNAGFKFIKTLSGNEESDNPLEATKVSNSFPLPEDYFRSTKNIELTKDLINTLTKNIGRKFAKDNQPFVTDFKKFNNNFKIYSGVIAKNLNIIIKDYKVLESYGAAFEILRRDKRGISELKSQLAKSNMDSARREKLHREYQHQLAESKSIFLDALKKAGAELEKAQSDAELSIRDKQHEATATINNFKRDSQKILDAYAKKKKLKGDELAQWESGNYDWGLLTVSDEAKKAREAYRIIHDTKAFDAQVASGTYEGALEDEINILSNPPKFTGKYKELGNAYDFAYSGLFRGDYRRYKAVYSLTKTPPEFEGQFKDLEDDYNLFSLKKCTGKYKKFEEVADKNYKPGADNNKHALLTKMEMKGSYPHYATFMNKVDKMYPEYERCYEETNACRKIIHTETQKAAAETSDLLRDAEGLTNGNPDLKTKIKDAGENVRKGIKAKSDKSGKITILEAVAVVNAIMQEAKFPPLIHVDDPDVIKRVDIDKLQPKLVLTK